MIRLRLTGLATLLVAAVLAATATGIVVFQRQQLVNNLDGSLRQRADAYEQTLVASEGDFDLVLGGDDDRAMQLVAPDGEVLLSTANLAGVGPIRSPSGGLTGVGHTGEVIADAQVAGLDDDTYRVLTRQVESPSGSNDLHVVQNTDDLNDAVRGLILGLGLVLPAAVAVLAGLSWWLVGRTLRPVEMIRAEVGVISGSDLHRRVPVSDRVDEISRLAATMNSMLDRVEGAAMRQRQFVADASHELRTPLTRMRTEVEVDLSHPDELEPLATHRLVLEEILTLQRLLDDLLFLARSDEGYVSTAQEVLSLDDIVLRSVANFGGNGGAVKKIDTAAVARVLIEGDPDQLTRVIDNLLSNAVRHAASKIEVSLQGDGGDAVLAIADDGPGVSPDQRLQIFERFGRSDDARARGDGGFGLGLAIVSDIVNRHGGSIHYDAGWTRGARFEVRLPDSLSRSPQH